MKLCVKYLARFDLDSAFRKHWAFILSDELEVAKGRVKQWSAALFLKFMYPFFFCWYYAYVL